MTFFFFEPAVSVYDEFFEKQSTTTIALYQDLKSKSVTKATGLSEDSKKLFDDIITVSIYI